MATISTHTCPQLLIWNGFGSAADRHVASHPWIVWIDCDRTTAWLNSELQPPTCLTAQPHHDFYALIPDGYPCTHI
jgi:hypothetical protein